MSGNGYVRGFGEIQSLKNYSEKCTPYCFYKLFYNCSKLIKAPIIGNYEPAKHCYSYIFYNCYYLSDIEILFLKWRDRMDNDFTKNWINNVGLYSRNRLIIRKYKELENKYGEEFLSKLCEIKFPNLFSDISTPLTFISKENNAYLSFDIKNYLYAYKHILYRTYYKNARSNALSGLSDWTKYTDRQRISLNQDEYVQFQNITSFGSLNFNLYSSGYGKFTMKR